MPNIERVDASYLLVCSVLVLLALPGLALFYGFSAGTRDRPLVVSRLFVVAPIFALQWVFLGCVTVLGPQTAIPPVGHASGSALAHAVFQTACAVVAAAILMCAIRARIKTSATVAFVVLWSTFVYDPVAYWVCRIEGLAWSLGAVVHLVGSGSALVCARFLDRAGRPDEGPPTSAAAVIAGAGLLSTSCFAMTLGGSPLASVLSARALESFALAAAGGGVAWVVSGWGIERSSPSFVGGILAIAGWIAVTTAGSSLTLETPVTMGFVASSAYQGMKSGSAAAAMAGLLAMTEATASANMLPSTAMAIALATGAVCYAAVDLRSRLGDRRGLVPPFGLHALLGLLAILLGCFLAPRGAAGGVAVGGMAFLGVQTLAGAVVACYCAGATLVLLRLVRATIGLNSDSAADESADRRDADEVIGMWPPQSRG